MYIYIYLDIHDSDSVYWQMHVCRTIQPWGCLKIKLVLMLCAGWTIHVPLMVCVGCHLAKTKLMLYVILIVMKVLDEQMLFPDGLCWMASCKIPWLEALQTSGNCWQSLWTWQGVPWQLQSIVQQPCLCWSQRGRLSLHVKRAWPRSRSCGWWHLQEPAYCYVISYILHHSYIIICRWVWCMFK